MTWQTATQFAIWSVGLAIALLVVMFCIAGIAALYDDMAERRSRSVSRFDRLLAEEKSIRKHQGHEIRARLHKLEQAVRELNPGINL